MKSLRLTLSDRQEQIDIEATEKRDGCATTLVTFRRDGESIVRGSSREHSTWLGAETYVKGLRDMALRDGFHLAP